MTYNNYSPERFADLLAKAAATAAPTTPWNWYGFDVKDPAATMGATPVPLYAADVIAGTWVEFPFVNDLGDTQEIAGQVVMVKDNGDFGVEILIHGYEAEETFGYVMADDDTVTAFKLPQGYVTGKSDVFVA